MYKISSSLAEYIKNYQGTIDKIKKKLFTSPFCNRVYMCQFGGHSLLDAKNIRKPFWIKTIWNRNHWSLKTKTRARSARSKASSARLMQHKDRECNTLAILRFFLQILFVYTSFSSSSCIILKVLGYLFPLF